MSTFAEAAANLRALASEIHNAANVTMIESTAQIEGEVKTYAAERPTSYLRTGYYGRNISSNVVDNGQQVKGYITSGAPYSVWLRGQPDGSYRQAWMHVGWWRPLVDILDEYIPKMRDALTSRINSAIQRIMGT